MARSNYFWVENLPLAGGTNLLTLTATDAAGNVTSTNVSVIQSLVAITLTSVPAVSNQVTVTVDGTINTAGYSVWVNGVKATTNGTYNPITWEAVNVPVNGLGTTVFDVLAITNSDNSGNGTGGGGGTNSTLANPGNPAPAFAASPQLVFDEDAEPVILTTHYTQTIHMLWTTSIEGLTNDSYSHVSWAENSPGVNSSSSWANYWNPGGGGGSWFIGFSATDLFWDQFGNGSGDTYTSPTNNDYSNPLPYGPYTVNMSSSGYGGEQSHYADSSTQWMTQDYISWVSDTNLALFTVQRDVASTDELRTGGKATSGREAVFELEASAEDMNHTPWPTGVDVPYTRMSVMSKPLGNDYRLFVTEPDGISVPVPVQVKGSSSFTYGIVQTKHQVGILANGITVPASGGWYREFCVGQYIEFSLDVDGLGFLSKSYATWKLPGTYVNDTWQNHVATGTGDSFGELLPVGSLNYTNNPDKLKGLSTPCWYIDKVQFGTARVNGKLYFSNGQDVNIAAFGQMIVDRPQAQFTSESAGPVQCSQLTGLVKFPISFHANVTSPFWTGEANWVQLIDRAVGGPNLLWVASQNTFGQYNLDNDPFVNTEGLGGPPFPTSVGPGLDGKVPFSDGPAFQIFYNGVTFLDDSVKTYLVFNPGGPNDIWVTLGIVTWGWGAKGIYSPRLPGYTTTDGTTDFAYPHYSNSQEFPVWTSILSNWGMSPDD